MTTATKTKPGLVSLELSMTTEVNHLSTEGDIYPDPGLGPLGSPEVSNVFARKKHSAQFQLSPGSYEYQFFVRNADGKFTLTLTRVGGGDVDSKDFDSKVGAAEVFAFTVT